MERWWDDTDRETQKYSGGGGKPDTITDTWTDPGSNLNLRPDKPEFQRYNMSYMKIQFLPTRNYSHSPLHPAVG
jgi:hypothetical protein